MRASAVVIATLGLLAGTTDCADDACFAGDCIQPRFISSCTYLQCVDSACTELLLDDVEPPGIYGNVPGDCVTVRCVAGVYTRSADDDDGPAPPEGPIHECYYDVCVDGILSLAPWPADAPCSASIAGRCDGASTCEPHVPPPCDDYCSFMDEQGCTPFGQCTGFCASSVEQAPYCIPELATYYACLMDAGLCYAEETGPCGEERARHDACKSPCGEHECDTVSTGGSSCTCIGGCNEHVWQVACDDANGGEETCECVLDDVVVGTCVEVGHACDTIGCCTDYFKDIL